MMGDLISVIVPVYNIAEYLPRSIGSILNQTYANIEIIAVDDGSKDDSLRVLREMNAGDSRLHVIHQENGGVTKARLAGIQEACGDWIGFVDGDDEIEPDMYERLLKNAKQYGAYISHCGYQMVFPSRVDYYYNTGRLTQQDNRSGLKDLIEGSFIEPGLWNKLFHKNLFHSLLHENVMDLNIKNNEDLLMNYYLFAASEKSVYEDFCPYHYILRPNSAATNKINKHKLLDPLLVTERLLKETEGDYSLHFALERKKVRQLISLATENTKKDIDLILPIQKNARAQLRSILKTVIVGKQYSIKMKAMAIWTSVWPASFRFVHEIHLKVTGLDKKYEIR